MSEKKETKNFKLVFAGSGPFAEPIFEALKESFNDITLIMKSGTPKESKIIQSAEKNKINTLQVSDKLDFQKKIKDIEPDVAVVVSFGIIISEETLKLPKHGFINVHYSLLPKYRGPSPVQSAILTGDSASGITFQVMDEKIDEGDILYQERVLISGTDTTDTLGKKMASLSAEKLPGVLLKYIKGEVKPQKQIGKPSYSKIIAKKDGRINWDESAEEIGRKVRAYTPWPSAYTFWNGKMLKILEASVSPCESGQKNGTFYELEPKKYGVQTGRGTLAIKKVQLEGKKPLLISDFLLGNSKIIDETI